MYHYLLASEGRLPQSFMPFPNEDNYFPRSPRAESGQSSHRRLVCVLRCRASLQPRTTNLVKKKLHRKLSLIRLSQFSVERESPLALDPTKRATRGWLTSEGRELRAALAKLPSGSCQCLAVACLTPSTTILCFSQNSFNNPGTCIDPDPDPEHTLPT